MIEEVARIAQGVTAMARPQVRTSVPDPLYARPPSERAVVLP
jgi:hypothetical protein